jgi:Rrf2 family protein
MIAASDGATSSESIARSVDTNPVVVRRLIGRLSKAGLVLVRKGQGGGAMLARPANLITLGEIYRAVEPGPLFSMPEKSEHSCPIGRYVRPVLRGIFCRAEDRVAADLDRTTLAEVMQAVQQQRKGEG